MHELPITQSICSLAVQEAERVGATKVYAIRIKMGEYTDYVPVIIQEYFNVVSEGTLAEGAVLEIETVPATLRCRACGAERRMEKFRMKCPACGSREVELLTGREFYIDSMEVETDDGD
ncbi:MAG: hydrogenase maturation nickel metallochaperone HypA [Clostridiales bacterium]|nr:hydrogenase maturation nickel metallochaperone HypA [Clostridiales bacterium]